MIIGRERAKSAEIAINELGADCLVMDDGFQHRALARDIDIVLIDALIRLAMTMYYHVVYYVNRLVVYRELYYCSYQGDQVAPGIVQVFVSV